MERVCAESYVWMMQRWAAMAFSQLASHVAMDDSFEKNAQKPAAVEATVEASGASMDSTLRQGGKGDEKDGGAAGGTDRVEQQRQGWREGKEVYGRDVLFHSGGTIIQSIGFS